jgi:protein-disulfide isomerase
MYDSLYAHQANWKAATVPSRVFAPYLGADVDRATYGGCYTRQALHPRTARANQIAAQLDVSRIPTFVVNERVMPGALSFAELRQAIDEELKKGTPTKG